MQHGDHERLDYYKLPHKDGAEANCGSPFSKDYMAAIESGTLRSDFADVRGGWGKMGQIACNFASSRSHLPKGQHRAAAVRLLLLLGLVAHAH